MKIIALYLPQYHQIPENDAWWGKGFTEWDNIKNAQSYFEGHNQPKIPFNNYYYDLSNISVMRWQTELAKKYGIYGFCFYHYWFNGKMLLQKPMENFLKDSKCDLPFCICWANHHWSNRWVSSNPQILMKQEYGDKKEWIDHFNYLLPFLKDERYIKFDGKPLIFIYIPQAINCLNEMIDCWQELALENGLPGLEFAGRESGMTSLRKDEWQRFDYSIAVEPGDSEDVLITPNILKVKKVWRKALLYMHKYWGKDMVTKRIGGPRKICYDEIWQAILKKNPINTKCVPGAFVNWDNTPRYKKNGTVYINASPEKFKKYLTMQIKHARNGYNKDFLFLFAWNEWSEGGYIEPDLENGYSYLESVRESLEDTGEFPQNENLKG